MDQMTWRELRDKLNTLTDEQLNTDVTIFDGNVGEFAPADGFDIADADDVLDTGHPFLRY